jgi:hypothetical protein
VPITLNDLSDQAGLEEALRRGLRPVWPGRVSKSRTFQNESFQLTAVNYNLSGTSCRLALPPGASQLPTLAGCPPGTVDGVNLPTEVSFVFSQAPGNEHWAIRPAWISRPVAVAELASVTDRNLEPSADELLGRYPVHLSGYPFDSQTEVRFYDAFGADCADAKTTAMSTLYSAAETWTGRVGPESAAVAVSGGRPVSRCAHGVPDRGSDGMGRMVFTLELRRISGPRELLVLARSDQFSKAGKSQAITDTVTEWLSNATKSGRRPITVLDISPNGKATSLFEAEDVANSGSQDAITTISRKLSANFAGDSRQAVRELSEAIAGLYDAHFLDYDQSGLKGVVYISDGQVGLDGNLGIHKAALGQFTAQGKTLGLITLADCNSWRSGAPLQSMPPGQCRSLASLGSASEIKSTIIAVLDQVLTGN